MKNGICVKSHHIEASGTGVTHTKQEVERRSGGTCTVWCPTALWENVNLNGFMNEGLRDADSCVMISVHCS